MAKNKTEKAKFIGIFVPTGLLAMKNISMIEKLVIADIGYFPNSYRFSNSQLAMKFGVSRRAIINAIQRLKSHKLQPIIDVGSDKYHRCLKLNGEIFALFEQVKAGERTDSTKKFQKPTAEEVTEYAASIGFELDGQHFVDYYQVRGWMAGKSRMKDWQAAVRNWQNRRKQDGNSSKSREHSEPAYADVR